MNGLKFRGHHLICLHFFSGEGYNNTYIDNLKIIMDRVKNNELEICSGADNICMKCPHLNDDRCQYKEGADEEIREMDSKALNLLHVYPGIGLEWQQVREMLPGIFNEWYKTYCIECKWRWVCEKDPFYQQLTGNK